MSSESETYKLTTQTPGNYDAAIDALTDGGGDYYGDYARLFNDGSVTTNLFDGIPREKWATILERTGYTGTLECTPEYTQPWKISFDGAAWRWRLDGARAYGPYGDSVVGHRDGALTVRAKGPVPFWVIKAVLRCDDYTWHVGYRRDEDPPEEELAQAIAAARADAPWDEDTEDAWTADDALALDLEDRLAAALASADADSSGRDFLDTEAYQLAVADAANYSTPDPEWLRLLQDADQISLTQPAGVGPDYRKYQHTYWTVLARAREAIEPEMRKVRAHFVKIAPDGCGDLEQDPSDASFVHVFGALAPHARRLAGGTTKVYAGWAAAWAEPEEDADDDPSEDPSREFFDDSNDDLLTEDAG